MSALDVVTQKDYNKIMRNQPVSFRLSPEGVVILNRLSQHMRIGRKDVIEVALSLLAKREWAKESPVAPMSHNRAETGKE